VEQTLVLLQDGVKKGYTPPKPMLRDVPKQIADLIPTDPMGSPLLEPFTKFPAGFPEAERIRSPIAPGKFTRAPSLRHSEAARLRGFDVLPACRESIAATALPNGAAAYAFSRPLADDHEADAAADSRNWTGGSEAHPRADGQSHRLAGFKGSFHDFTEISAHGSAILLRQAR